MIFYWLKNLYDLYVKIFGLNGKNLDNNKEESNFYLRF